jgi:hypothetical protein
MRIDRDRHHGAAGIVARPTPGQPRTLQLHVKDDSLSALGVSPGATLQAERGRQPSDGDLVWVELVRYGSLVHLLRRYSACEGMVSLADPAHREPAIIREPGELLISAVVISPRA